MVAAVTSSGAGKEKVSVGRIVLACLVGATIEFHDFCIYGAAALAISQAFFPRSAPGAQAFNAFLTFGAAFPARPLGSVFFGHFGERIARRATLAASMLTMEPSTALLPKIVPALRALRRRCERL